MARALTIRNLYDKVFSFLPLEDEWLEAIGTETEDSGVWLIYGKEKNGKTTFALKLANYLSTMRKVLYISAEENISTNIQRTCRRLGIPVTNKALHVIGYMSIDALKKMLKQRKSADIIFIDNTSKYKYDLKPKALYQLIDAFPNKLFIFLAHESRKEKGEPDAALAQECKKLAKRYFRIVGMVAEVGGRTEPYLLPIDGDKAALFHGDIINQ